jgi:hypothetical protein
MPTQPILSCRPYKNLYEGSFVCDSRNISLFDQIIDATTAATGLPHADVFGVARVLREKKLFPRMSRAAESQFVPDEDLARLVLGVMFRRPATKAPEFLAELAEAEMTETSRARLAEALPLEGFPALNDLLQPRRYPIEALAALIRTARRAPTVFEQRAFNSVLELDLLRRSAELYLEIEAQTPLKYAVRTHLEFDPTRQFHRGGLNYTARLHIRDICQIADAAERTPE